METLLRTVLLFGLVVTLQTLSFQPGQQKFTGIWYLKAAVATKAPPQGKKPWKVSPVAVTALEGGNLEISIAVTKKGRCHEKKIMMQKTEEPGKYSTFRGKKLIYVEKLPVEDHYILYCEDQRQGKTFAMGKLMGRTPEENPEALEQFKKFMKRKRLPADNMVIPEQEDGCVSGDI